MALQTPMPGAGSDGPATTRRPADGRSDAPGEPDRRPRDSAAPIRAAGDAPAIVNLAGVTKDFGEGVGVREISLAVPPGTILGVIGPSGSGKTTTIRLITGALDPTAGTIRVLGEDPRTFRRRTRERIGYMPQLFTLYPDLTADENVDFVASLFGMLTPRRRRRVAEVLRLVELWDARDRRAGQLSGGMQRRLELACALVHEPDLLLLDEPTAGIDPILRQAIWHELERLRDLGRTLLVTTQYVTEAEECDTVALITDGRLVALDAPEALRRRAAGGDLVEVETEAPFDPEGLVGSDGVLAARSTGLRRFRVAVEDAGRTLPVLDDLVAEAGARVVAAREIRLSFDEVFASLVADAEEGTRPDEEPAGTAPTDEQAGPVAPMDTPPDEASTEVPA